MTEITDEPVQEPEPVEEEPVQEGPDDDALDLWLKAEAEWQGERATVNVTVTPNDEGAQDDAAD